MPGSFLVPLKEALLYQRLSALLDLQTPTQVPDMSLWPNILPVLDIWKALAPMKMADPLFTITGTGWKTITTVPVGKFWNVSALAVYTVTGGALSIDSFRLLAPGGEYASLEAWTSAAPPRVSTFGGQYIEALAEWALQVNCSAFTAQGNMRGELLYKEFDAL